MLKNPKKKGLGDTFTHDASAEEAEWEELDFDRLV